MAENSAHGSSASPPAGTVADRLRAARRRQFVGRGAELALFREALAAPEPPFSVLWVFGPGGVGKTTLLGALSDEAAASGREPVQLDLRGIEPSPHAFSAAVARAAGLPADLTAREALAGGTARCSCSTPSRRRWGSRTGCAARTWRRFPRAR